jgi:murein DD-endopeptidase MepM/ murein hydrolase activator NlpD
MRTPFRTLAFVLLLAAVAAVPASALAQTDPIAQAEERVRAARAAADEASARYEAAYSHYFELNDDIERLRGQLQEVEAEAARLRELASERAVEAYMGQGTDFTNLLDGRDVLEAARRNELLQRVNARGVDAVDRLGAVSEDLVDRQAELEQAIAEQEGVVEELRGLEAQLRDRLAEAQQALADEIAQKAARDAAAAAAAERAASASPRGGSGQILVNPGGGGFVCPVQGARSFVDSWGAPRSGGRSHQGVDIMSPFGTPVVAVVSGSISQRTGGLGGNAIWLNGSNGTSYYYAHLQSFVGGSRSVSAGEMIGTVGDTGNAQGGAPHLHFEIHPGGGAAVNPYPTVAQYC